MKRDREIKVRVHGEPSEEAIGMAYDILWMQVRREQGVEFLIELEKEMQKQWGDKQP